MDNIFDAIEELPTDEPRDEDVDGPITPAPGKQLSSPFSTGGGGAHFEACVQAAFVALMITRGFAPCLERWPIKKIKFQGKRAEYDVDDLIVFAEKPDGTEERKLHGQIKRSISITPGDEGFGEVITAAWTVFNKPHVFSQGRDVIALITSSLSADTSDAREILEWARSAEDAEEFIAMVGEANFSSKNKQKKLETFQIQLQKANSGNPLSNEQLFDFLKHFHVLGYDLDLRAGVTLSLLHSLIGQYAPENAHGLWTQIMYEVQTANKYQGTITLDKLPYDLKIAFERPAHASIPVEFALTSLPRADAGLSTDKYAIEQAIAGLMGSWNEQSSSDTAIIGQLAGQDFTGWLSKLREIIQEPASPVVLKNGIWKIAKRLEGWHVLGPMLFDDSLDQFKRCAVAVLTERSPEFDLAPEDRYAAGIYGKDFAYSHDIRKGLAESLALLGCYPDALSNCSRGKAETVATLAVREIFKQADWLLWGSLNNLLPLLVEAAPTEFLRAVEDALQQNPCPFDELFAQSGDGFTGRNYVTGLLWSLEALAWDEHYLVQAIILLGELVARDPGLNRGNRPAESLAKILLPWRPQTLASADKRRVAVSTLYKELPDVAWKLLLVLLPKQHQMATPSYKPFWRVEIPEEMETVTTTEYREQIAFYAEMAVEMAKDDPGKLSELVKHLASLTSPSFDKAVEYMSSDDIVGRPEAERLNLWAGLAQFALKHRRFADTEWALREDTVERIEVVAARLAPRDPRNLYQPLFEDRNYDLYEENGSWEKQRQRLEERRQQAIKKIVDALGVEGVIEFAKTVAVPFAVGSALASIIGPEVDEVIVPGLLGAHDQSEFISGYIRARYWSQGWPWVDSIQFAGWSPRQIGEFLAELPFVVEAWERAKALLGEFEADYWTKARIDFIDLDAELGDAIDKLIEYGRLNLVIDCLCRIVYANKPLDKSQAVRALLAAASSTEALSSVDAHEIVEIIKALQDDPDTNPDDLFNVEWAYVAILDGHHGATPKLLEARLSSDPSFFCEVIRLVFRSKNETAAETEQSAQEKAVAMNAYRLLANWRMPPGLQPDGEFSEELFSSWLEAVKGSAAESGHLNVALTHAGESLINSPAEPNGLWINHAVAEALNAKDAEKLRQGFHIALSNSRGVHLVDPTGKPELELADKYNRQADDVENAGFQRLAATLRDMADCYVNEAKQIVDEHEEEDGNP